MLRSVVKYWAVFSVAARNQWAYIGEVLVRSVFIVIIMYVFAQLWATTYAAAGMTSLSGYDVRTVVWYLAVTEAIITGTPALVNLLSDEIKQGDIAYRLVRPVNYVLYNYAQFMGEATVRVGVNLVITGVVAALFFGLPDVSWVSTLSFPLVAWVALTAQFTMTMSICLLLFWIEDGRGLNLILSRLVMILGGMMIPLPLFPQWLASVCQWLPFQAVAYLPARMLVNHSGDGGVWGLTLAVAWTALLAAVCAALYRKGVRQLHVQGG